MLFVSRQVWDVIGRSMVVDSEEDTFQANDNCSTGYVYHVRFSIHVMPNCTQRVLMSFAGSNLLIVETSQTMRICRLLFSKEQSEFLQIQGDFLL